MSSNEEGIILYDEGVSNVNDTRSHYSFSSSIFTPLHVDRFVYSYDQEDDMLKVKKDHKVGLLDLELHLALFRATTISCLGVYDRRKFTHLYAAGLKVCNGFVEFFSKNFSSTLTYIDVSYTSNISHENLLHLNSLTTLVDLNISGIICVSDWLITELHPTIARLSGLYLDNCKLLTDNALMYIGDNAHRTKFLRFSASFNPNFTFKGVNKFLYMQEQLDVFNMESCPNVKFMGLVIRNKDMLGEIMIQYASRKISCLNVSNLQLVPESMDWIASACGSLRSLEANNLDGLTDGHLQGLVNISSNKLEKLSFYGNKKLILTDQSLMTITSCCCNTLVDLNMSNVSTFDAGDKRSTKFTKCLAKLFMNCQSLKYVDISNVSGVNDGVFIGMRMICDKLLKLNVAFCNLSDAGLAKIADFFPNLKYLNISNIYDASDQSVTLLARRCVNMRTFVCRNCEMLTDQSILEIFSHCKMIQCLILSNDRRYLDAWGARFCQFTDEIMVAVMKSRTLKALEICNQFAIDFKNIFFKTGNDFGKIGNHSIEKLDLRGLDNISLTKLSYILQNCYSLNHVVLPFNKEEFKSGVVDRDFIMRSFERKLYGSSDELLALLMEVPSTIKSTKRKGASKKGAEDSLKQLSTLLSPNKKEKTPLSILIEKRSIQAGLMKAAYSSSMKSSDCVFPLDLPYSVPKDDKDDTISVNSSAAGESLKKTRREAEAEIEALKGESESLIKEKSIGLVALLPHEYSYHFRYRDAYVTRRMLENKMCNKIQLKYRQFKMWQRFAYRVSARKIANTYKIVLERRKLMIRIQNFIMNRSVKLIQRKFRSGVMRFARKAMRIQRFWRLILFHKRCTSLKLRHRCATIIQKVFRGTRVRLSDGYILRQVFMKLPPFWKSFMTSTKNPDGTELNTRQLMDSFGKPIPKEKANRKKLFLYQVEDLTKDAQRMQKHILNEICTDGALAPKIPKIVPQKFDKEPFVSLNDGRIITFYSTKNSILATTDDDYIIDKKTGERKAKQDGITGVTKARPLHIFNIQLWPHTAPIVFEDTSTLLFDNHKNSFDIIENWKHMVYCDLCNNRLRSVNCNTCRRGLCFYCAFRIHCKPGKRMHEVTVAEPRIVNVKEVENSLVYHIDNALQVNHEIQYLVKYLRSAAEVQRINNEKKLMKEFEAEQERKRQEYLVASAEVKEKHDAATIIECIIRRMIAKRVVNERRVQFEVERYMKEKNKHHDAVGVVLIQRIFREFSTRLWLSKFDIKFKKLKNGSGNKFKKKKTPKVPFSERISKKEIEKRVNWEIQQRRIIERKICISNFFYKYIECMQTIDANIAYWLKYASQIPITVEKLQETRAAFHLDHSSQVAEVAMKKADISQEEFDKLERVSRSLSVRVEFMDNRIDNENNAVWWIKEILRNNFRRRSAIKERLIDVLHRNIWLTVESSILSRIENIILDRKRRLLQKPRVKLLINWLEKYALYTSIHHATLDVSQQSLLTEETEKLSRDLNSTIEADNLLQELVTALKQDSLYYSERVSLDKISILAGTDKTNSVDQNDVVGKLVLIKTKQMQLQENVIDTVKLGLQQKMNAETDFNQKFYGFCNDSPDTPINELHKISAILIDKFGASSDYINTYLHGPNWKKEKEEREKREADNAATEALRGTASAALAVLGSGVAAIKNLFGGLFGGGNKDKGCVEEVKEDPKEEKKKKKKKKKGEEEEKKEEPILIEDVQPPDLSSSSSSDVLVVAPVVEEKVLTRKERLLLLAKQEEERISAQRIEEVEKRKELAQDMKDHGPKHLSIKEFYSIYHIQPWLAEQAVADVRAEEQLAVKEVELEKVLFEYSALIFQIKDTTARIERTKKELKDINEEIAWRQDPFFRQREKDMDRKVFDEVTEEEEEERKEQLQALEVSMLAKTTDLDLSEQMIMQYTELEKPKLIRRDEIISEISISRQGIETRVKDREDIGDTFYKHEEEVCHYDDDDDEDEGGEKKKDEDEPEELDGNGQPIPKRLKTPKLRDTVMNEILTFSSLIGNEAASLKKHALVCELYQYSNKYLNDVVEDNLTIDVRNSLDVARGNWNFRVNHIMHGVKPRQYTNGIDLARIHIDLRSLVLFVQEFGLNEVKTHVEEEEKIVETYKVEVEVLKNKFSEYKAYMLLMRRQKSLQTEIYIRKEKLKQVRELAILTLKEKKAMLLKKLEDARAASKEQKHRQSRIFAQIGQNIKQGIRGMKDFVRDFSSNMDARMDLEEQKIAKNIKEKNKEGATSKPEGIRRLMFTQGEQETSEFFTRNQLLREKGLPFYTKLEKSVGNQLFLWYQSTYDPTLFITMLKIAHKDPGHPLYQDPEVLTTAGMEATRHSSTSMVIWLKRDAQKSRGLAALELTFKELEEVRAIQDGFEKIDLNLAPFDLPDTYLWEKRVNKVSAAQSDNTNSIIAEIIKVRGVLKKQPYDKALQQVHEKLREKLARAHKKEKGFEVTNPLQSAVELMALSVPELETFMKTFEKMDTDQSGRVTLAEVFEFFETYRNPFFEEMFHTVDATELEFGADEETVEFGDFMRAIATYGFFGKEEILRSLFVFADKEKAGVITHAQYVGLLNDLFPFDKSRPKRALKDMQLDPKKEMQLAEFKTLNDQFPGLMYPAFQFQKNIRERLMGYDWWYHKLEKYKTVRRKLALSGANQDKVVEIELERFSEDQIREKRMKQREKEIDKEGSEIRKVYLMAQQFLDEVS